jgi:SAM-dependent methyltransferase
MENQGQVNYISSLVGYKTPARYIARAKFIFDTLELKNKRVLDVGCGKGGLLAWVALQGAAFVLGLEPEEDGVVDGSYTTLERVISTLSLDTVEISRSTLNGYSFSQPFDIVILYNVINHLNEHAVVDLHSNPDSHNIFIGIAKKIRSLMADNGVLILADAARSNLWGDLGIKSPFARTLEWRKHQNPAIWRALFENIGFRTLDLRWSQHYLLGKWPSNFLMRYVTSSHFVMRFILDNENTIGNR